MRLGVTGRFDSRSLYMTPGVVAAGDELFFYYTGLSSRHDLDLDHDEQPCGGRLRVRLDGFVSQDAEVQESSLTTVPFILEGNRLQLNMDASSRGWLKVEILDASGHALWGFSKAEADRLMFNDIAQAATWNGSRDLSGLRGRHVRLRFVGQSAKLYAFVRGLTPRRRPLASERARRTGSGSSAPDSKALGTRRPLPSIRLPRSPPGPTQTRTIWLCSANGRSLDESLGTVDASSDHDQELGVVIRFATGLSAHIVDRALNGVEVICEHGVFASDYRSFRLLRRSEAIGNGRSLFDLVEVADLFEDSVDWGGPSEDSYDEDGWLRMASRQAATAQSMIDALDEDIEPRASGENARAVLELAIALRESARRGHQPVRLPLEDRNLQAPCETGASTPEICKLLPGQHTSSQSHAKRRLPLAPDAVLFPRFDDHSANWKGPSLSASPEVWSHVLEPSELADLNSVIQRFGNNAQDLTSLSVEDVSMPALAPRLADLKAEVLDGVGFYLLRGLPVANFSLREAATAFWAVGLHLGEPVSQNAGGHALGHVRDLGFDYSQPSARGGFVPILVETAQAPIVTF